MGLVGMTPMDEESTLVWQNTTANQIADYIISSLGEDSVSYLDVNVTMLMQDPPFELSAVPSASPSGSPVLAPVALPTSPQPTEALPNAETFVRRRKLQESEAPSASPSTLQIGFGVSLMLQSDVEDHDLNSYVTGAFETEESQEEYLQDLQASGDPAFDDVAAVSVAVAPSPPTAGPTNPPGGGGDDTNAGLIAGLVVAGAAVVALGGFYAYTKRKQRGGAASLAASADLSEDKPKATPLEAESHDLASDLGSGQYDEGGSYGNEVSTLGDPTSVGGDADRSVSTLQTLDYDYQRQTLAAMPSVASSADEDDSNLIMAQDDDTLDAQYVAVDRFEVEAPSGMLGLVLESSADGVPTVHAIKSSSPLVTQVCVGDQLLSVDGEDVTVMLSSEVSKVIASKKDNPVRKFVFTRPYDRDKSFDASESSHEDELASYSQEPVASAPSLTTGGEASLTTGAASETTGATSGASDTVTSGGASATTGGETEIRSFPDSTGIPEDAPSMTTSVVFGDDTVQESMASIEK